MNYIISVLLHIADSHVLNALYQLLPAKGRPYFDDEINPEWKEIYRTIQMTQPPEKLERHGQYLLLEWYELEQSAAAFTIPLEKAGAEVIFVYACGEIAADDACLLEDDEGQDEGVYQLKVSDTLQRLTAHNLKQVLSGYPAGWSDDEDNPEKITHYLINCNYLG